MTATLHSTDPDNDRCPACGKRLAHMTETTAAAANELGKLWQAIVDNTKGDLFWIGEILLNELEKETGFNPHGIRATEHVLAERARLPTCLQKAQTTPPGWRLVPEAPTQEMLRAAREKAFWSPEDYAGHYRAMLSAAPPSPRAPSEEEIRLTIGGIIVGLDLTNVERARVAAGEATAAVLALFTPHQGEGN